MVYLLFLLFPRFVIGFILSFFLIRVSELNSLFYIRELNGYVIYIPELNSPFFLRLKM